MYVQPLANEKVSDFIQYCNKYGKEHDESYLPNEDFKVSSEEPSFLLYNQKNELIGVASLMTNNGRFKILHSIKPVYDNYKYLIDEMINNVNGLSNIYLFLPDNKLKVRDILESLGFELQRYTWYLERNNTEIDNLKLSNGIEIKKLEWDKEENIWCEIINNNFKDHQGFSYLQIEDVKKMKEQNNHNHREMLILWKDEKPIGTIQLEMDVEDGIKIGYISWLSINKQYRGLGLGRSLLKYAVMVANKNNAKKVGLVVHSINEKAVQLYQSEGFKNIESFVCYNMKLKS